MTRIVMLLSNAFRPDPRVQKEARALAAAGYAVTVIAWDRESKFPAQEQAAGFTVRRVQEVRSGYGAGPRQLLRLPRFWTAAVRLAAEMQPDLVHCHDLDTLYAGWRLKRRLGCPLIYDAHEHYPALMSLYLPRPFVWALAAWERWLLRRVDGVITASSVLGDEFAARGVRPVITLGNFQDVAPYAAVPDADAAAVRSQLGVAPNQLLVAYIGGLSRNRLLLPVIEAAALLPDVQVHLWGDGPQAGDIERAVARQANTHFHGWLASDRLPVHFRAADIIVYLLRLDYPGAVYNAPNTLAQAMAAGRPIIANDVGDLGRIVRVTQCGLLLQTASPPAIAAAIEQLRDPALRRRLGDHGREAAESTYNTAAMQSQLAQLYARLLPSAQI